MSDNKETEETHSKEAKQASKKASEYRNRAQEAKNRATEHAKEARLSLIKIRGIAEKVDALKVEVSNANESVHEKASNIEQAVLELVGRKTELNKLVAELEQVFANHPEFDQEIALLEEKITKTEEQLTKANTVYKNTLSKKQEIDELHVGIVGYDEVDEETNETHHIEGLKDKLESTYDNLTQKLSETEEEIDELKTKNEENFEGFKSTWEEKYKSLQKQIEDLLPNALTAGLSSAYSSKKSAEEEELSGLTKRFNWGLIGLVLVSLIPFAVSLQFLWNGLALESLILKLPRLVLAILPLYIPVLWLAYSANKKMNLSKRLIEEYTHKEVLSKTFEGLSTQIESIENTELSSELRIRLLYNILEVSSENPGKLISNYNKSDHPLMDALEKSDKLSRAVDKLENIPGLGKLSKILDNKSKKIVSESAEKIAEVLDTVE